MDWCSVYLTPQGLPKYIYFSPLLIFPTTYSEIRRKNRPVWITPGPAPIRWMGPIHNPPWEPKRTEGYVIVSNVIRATKIHFYVTFAEIQIALKRKKLTVYFKRRKSVSSMYYDYTIQYNTISLFPIGVHLRHTDSFT